MWHESGNRFEFVHVFRNAYPAADVRSEIDRWVETLSVRDGYAVVLQAVRAHCG